MAQDVLERDMDSMPKELAALGRGRQTGVLIPWAHMVGTRTGRPRWPTASSGEHPHPECGQMAGEENSRSL